MRVQLSDGRIVQFVFRVRRKKHGNHTSLCMLSVFRDAESELASRYYGEAHCCRGDKYNKVMGKVVALERAMGHLMVSEGCERQGRVAIWNAFRECFKDCPDARILGRFTPSEAMLKGFCKSICSGVVNKNAQVRRGLAMTIKAKPSYPSLLAKVQAESTDMADMDAAMTKTLNASNG